MISMWTAGFEGYTPTALAVVFLHFLASRTVSGCSARLVALSLGADIDCSNRRFPFD
jgi:hypothetical protein